MTQLVEKLMYHPRIMEEHVSNPKAMMNKKIAEQLAQAKLDEAIAKQRNSYLSRLGTSIQVTLDQMLQTEHDKLSVLVGLTCSLAAQGNGTWGELERVLKSNFELQKELFEKFKAEQAVEAAKAEPDQKGQPDNLVSLA